MKMLLVGLLLMPYYLQAQNPEIPEKTISPYFFVKSNDKTDQMPMKSTSADVQIAGVIADVTITQVYVNQGRNALEAIYVFPASTRAAVYAMTMTIGNRRITANIEEKNKAREQYEEAKEQGKTASLLEQKRPNVFQMNVANIMPNDSITVVLRYTELLVPTEGIYEFSYPTVVGPRYSTTPEDDATDYEKWVANPYLKEGQAPTYQFNISARLNAGMPIQEVFCSSHKVNVNYQDKNIAKILLDATETDGGNRDYILKYRLAGGQVQSGVLIYNGENEALSDSQNAETVEPEKFFLLMMQPPRVPTDNQIPPREYVFIIDVSGSMSGFPLEISKKFIKNLIGSLRPTDKFNIMLFESSNAMLYKESVNATAQNIDLAMQVIDRQQGSGGTNLLPALKNTFAFPNVTEFARSFVVVTDGYVTVEKEAFDLIRNQLNQANLFAFGIGSSVNRLLIEGMARAGQGEPFFITKPEEADNVAQKFIKYVQHPVLTNIKVSYEGCQVYDINPVAIPDVFAQRPVIIYGKFKGKAEGKITIEGLSGNSTYTYTALLQEANTQNNQALRYLWARNQIAILGDYTKLYTSDSQHQKRIEEITQLGLKYNLLTDYTSFIAIDEEVRNVNGKLETVKQPLPLPQGVSNNAVGEESEDFSRGGVSTNFSNVTTTNQKDPKKSYNKTVVKEKHDVVDVKDEVEEVFLQVESLPEYQGGIVAFYQWFEQEFQKTPEYKQANKTTLAVTLEIDEQGKVVKATIDKGSLGAAIDKVIIDILLKSANWKPGTMNGKPTKSKISIPIYLK